MAASVLLAACASHPASQTSSADTFTTPDVPARAYSSITTTDVAADTCGAQGMAWLVGRPRTEIPVSADLTNRWVRSTVGAAPAGVVPQRLNILYDPNTGVVTRVQCG